MVFKILVNRILCRKKQWVICEKLVIMHKNMGFQVSSQQISPFFVRLDGRQGIGVYRILHTLI